MLEKQEPCPTPKALYDCPLGAISVSIIQSLARIEENSEHIKKQIEGNGVPGLLTRMDSIESWKDKYSGKMLLSKMIISYIMPFILILASAATSWYVTYHWHTTSTIQEQKK